MSMDLNLDFIEKSQKRKVLNISNKMIDYSLKGHKACYLILCMEQLYSYTIYFPEEIERFLPLMETKIDSIISHRSDKEN